MNRVIDGYSYTTVFGRLNCTWNREMGHGLIDAYNAVLGARRRL
ncbi:hypothetical protein [Bacteroides graminisolvens]|nr:hypothetical protein [Bacteroides graminisolvens]